MIKLTNLEQTLEIIFDNVNYVLNSKDFGKADIDVNSYQGYNQIGVVVTNRTVGTRDVSITGFILAENADEMLQKKRFLQRVVNPLQDFLIVVDNKYKMQVSAQSSIEYGTEYAENNSYLAKFNIDGIAAVPCFTTWETSLTSFAYWKTGFRFPLRMAESAPVIMGERVPALLKNINNEGELDCGMKITFSTTGTVVNPFVTNIFTEERLTLDLTINSGDILIVNTEYGNKTATLNGEDVFYNIDLDSDFLQLHEGENYIRYGAESGENVLDATIEYTPLYLEV